MKLKPFTVSEIVDIINEEYLKIGDFWIIGEISNLKVYPSGHTYFTLKDEKNQIDCVLFYGRRRNQIYEPENSKKFLIYGHLDYYGKGGKTQIIVEEIIPAGIGELALKFEMLKEKLAKEGLFAQEHKKSLPKFPQKIGIVTSLEGAALKDMVRKIRERFPPVNIIVRPSLVQGEQAAEDIAKGIKELNDFGDVDVIIVGRGGGSIEDLWAFNEEIVARAIYDSKIPIISAVGHAENITIADLVADERAITPTDAANKVVPSKDELLALFKSHKRIMILSLERKKKMIKDRIKITSDLKVFKYPLSIVEKRYIDIDRLYERMCFSLNAKLKISKQKLLGIKIYPPYIKERNNEILNYERSIKRDISRSLFMKKDRLLSLEKRLLSLSPDNILKKGYSIVFKGENIVKSVKILEKSDNVRIKFFDGEKNARIL